MSVFIFHLFALFCSSATFASSGAAGEMDMSFVYKLINFALLLLILHLFAKSPLKKLLVNALKNSLSKFISIKEEKKDWDDKLNVYKKKVESLEDEIKELRENADQSMIREREETLKETEKIADRIIEQSSKQTEMLINGAKKQFQEQLLEKAFSLAESEINKKLDSSKQKDSVKQYISSLN
jgi:F0F1-type ATP synthase membrane subunit b/b'